jgi:ribosome-binding protein aMBF1 (putative translation factor)
MSQDASPNDRMPMFHQNWDPVILKKRQVDRAEAKRRTQAQAGPNARVTFSSDAALQRKLAESDEIGQVKLKTLSPQSRQEIVQRRVANAWNQQQLNQQCGFPANLIRDIESGRVTPSPTQLNILNRILRAALRYA